MNSPADRCRSFWAWGWEDRFPTDDARASIASLLAHRLGVTRAPCLAPLPVLASTTLRAARIPVPDPLRAIATDANEDRIRHTYGRAYRDVLRGLRGDFSPAPDLVAYPRHEDDVAAVLDWASTARVAVVPFGGGTSVVGGVECAPSEKHTGVLSLDLARMNRVVEVDALSRAARIQAGTLGPDLERQLAPHGLSLRHYPQSFEFSTVGGWIATRAGGHFATLHTHIDDSVESVRMVTPAGVFATRRFPASGAGPSPERLVLGSEGTLGVITEAWLRLHARPRWRARASVHFDSFERAVTAVRNVAQSGLHPSNCRLLDRDEAQLNGVVDHPHHVLLLGFESADHDPSAAMARALEIVQAEGAECVRAHATVEGDRDDAASWRAAFLEAPYIQSALVSAGFIADTFETACTWDRFAELYRAVTESVTAELHARCGAGMITCRFTHAYSDGPAPYFTFVAPSREGHELEVWDAVKRVASDALAANGGTITHHHAVGRMHRRWYDRERPALFADALRAVKERFDPAHVLNPGVLFDVR